MSGNRGVVYVGPGKVEVRTIADPQLVESSGRKENHGVILCVVATNICGFRPAYGSRSRHRTCRARPWP